MDPLHDHAVSCALVSPEQLSQHLSRDEEIKNAMQLQKKSFEDYKKYVEKAKEAQDECVGSSGTLFGKKYNGCPLCKNSQKITNW